MDNPVRTYSSGMYMRLAFSVAINVNADILLIDEILAVGDINFQAKCFNKLKEIKAQGTTIVIVSHSLGQIEQICDRTIWLDGGKIKADGKPRDVHPEYMDFMGQKRQVIAEKENARKEEKSGKKAGERTDDESDSAQEEKKRWGNGHARINQVRMLDANGKSQSAFSTGSPITIEMDYSVKEKVEDAVFGIGIFNQNGQQVYGTNTRIDQMDEFALEKDGTMRVALDSVNLLPGIYLLDIAIESQVGIPVDYFREAYTFEMYSQVGDVGIVRLDHQWEI